MSDFAVGLEAPPADAGAGATEPVESAQPGGEQPGGEPTGDGGEPGGEPSGPEPAIVDGKLSASHKAALDLLKNSNDPKVKAAADDLRRALYTAERVKAALPGGLAEVKQLRDRIEALGGDQGIQEAQQELNGWREFDELYTSGDAKLIDFMMETPEGKDAFMKIAPLAWDRYAQIHPEGWGNYVANAFMGDMAAADIPLILQRLGDFLPADNPKVTELYNKITAYVNRIGDLARKTVAAPKSEAAPKDDGRAQLEQERQQFQRQTWQSEADRNHARLFQQAWQKHVGTRKLTEAQQKTLRDLYGVRHTSLLRAKRDFSGGLERFFKAGQKDGFLRLHEATFKETVPLALRQAMGELGLGKPGPKAGAAPAAKPGPAKTPTGKPDAGFTRVGQKPEFGTVDRGRTTTAMWQNKQAVLKGGQKVTWA